VTWHPGLGLGAAGVAGWHHPQGGGVRESQLFDPGSADCGVRRL